MGGHDLDVVLGEWTQPDPARPSFERRVDGNGESNAAGADPIGEHQTLPGGGRQADDVDRRTRVVEIEAGVCVGPQRDPEASQVDGAEGVAPGRDRPGESGPIERDANTHLDPAAERPSLRRHRFHARGGVARQIDGRGTPGRHVSVVPGPQRTEQLEMAARGPPRCDRCAHARVLVPENEEVRRANEVTVQRKAEFVWRADLRGRDAIEPARANQRGRGRVESRRARGNDPGGKRQRDDRGPGDATGAGRPQATASQPWLAAHDRHATLGAAIRTIAMETLRKLGVVLACVATFLACERPPLCPEEHFGTEVTVPATQSTFAMQVERFGAEIAPGPNGVAVSMVDNVGTVAFEGRGPASAFIYATEAAPSPPDMLYAGLGIEDGAWFPFWLYCSPDGHLDRFYGEMTDRDLGVLIPVDGTCAPSGEMQNLTLDIPAHTLRQVALSCGFSVQATAPTPIDLGSSRAGSVDFAGDTSTLLPFHTVDCRTGCGDQSWYEIHAILWDQVRPSVGFTIIYLYPGESEVDATNGLLLPLATPLGDSFPNAVWTLGR
jgi:hypothetical protein